MKWLSILELGFQYQKKKRETHTQTHNMQFSYDKCSIFHRKLLKHTSFTKTKIPLSNFPLQSNLSANILYL